LFYTRAVIKKDETSRRYSIFGGSTRLREPDQSQVRPIKSGFDVADEAGKENLASKAMINKQPPEAHASPLAALSLSTHLLPNEARLSNVNLRRRSYQHPWKIDQPTESGGKYSMEELEQQHQHHQQQQQPQEVMEDLMAMDTPALRTAGIYSSPPPSPLLPCSLALHNTEPLTLFLPHPLSLTLLHIITHQSSASRSSFKKAGPRLH
jgi:hypothetical protein